jgi:hypothetical protein
MGERERLAAELADVELIKYFYLDKDPGALVERLDSMRFELVESQDEVPFNAQVKSYFAARDEDGDPWIVKPVATEQEMIYHRSCMLAYLLDHMTGTLAAPTTATLIDGKKYRVTKVVRHAMQISSYNYMEAPFLGLLRADLVNRWIYFDEDRNPNNYLVITNKANKPFIVAIDYDKADMMSEAMKITGMEEKFGWLRTEKTRFLTLLRPENFEGVSIADFDERLKAFAEVGTNEFRSYAKTAFKGWCEDADATATLVTRNFLRRREYVDRYFRLMFKAVNATENTSHDDEYLAFGQSFLDMHKKKG